MKKLFALILTIVLCFYAVGAVTENEKLEAGNPVATTPETPEGMTADEVCGFVYFVPNGWTEDVNDVHESEKVYRINPDDNSAVLRSL